MSMIAVLGFSLLVGAPVPSAHFLIARDRIAAYTASVCAAQDDPTTEVQMRLLKEHSRLATWMAEQTVTGKLTGIDLVKLGHLPSIGSACRSEEEKRQAEKDARYFSPENQLRIYCLPEDEQRAILRETIPPEHRDFMDEYFDLWYTQLEASHASDKSALCKNGKPLPEHERSG